MSDQGTAKVAGEDLDQSIRDLFNHIAGGAAAEWKKSVRLEIVAED